MAIEDFETKLELPENANYDSIEALLSTAIIESNLPIGVGLGSSASLSCALARCFPHENAFEMAKRFDDRFHQGSSGIDVFTILNGGLCSLSPKRGFEKCQEVLLKSLAQFSFSIINTGTERRVSTIKSQLDPGKVKSYAVHLGIISDVFYEHLKLGTLTLQRLCFLLNEANALLIGLGVSTPQLDELFHKISESGLQLGAKITGGGGGGCVLLVHSPEVSQEQLQSFVPTGGALYYQIKLKP